MSKLSDLEIKQAERIFDELANAGTVLEQLSADLMDMQLDGNPPIGFIGAVGYLGKVVGVLGDKGIRVVGGTAQHSGGFDGWFLGQEFARNQVQIAGEKEGAS